MPVQPKSNRLGSSRPRKRPRSSTGSIHSRTTRKHIVRTFHGRGRARRQWRLEKSTYGFNRRYLETRISDRLDCSVSSPKALSARHVTAG